jgi:hypothetical protein
MWLAEVNEAVLQAIEEHALTPKAVEQVIHLTEPDDLKDRQIGLEREQRDLEERLARLRAAIETGGRPRRWLPGFGTSKHVGPGSMWRLPASSRCRVWLLR